MRPYEVVVIFDVGSRRERHHGRRRISIVGSSTRGGNPGRVERWGRRSFAYELKHRSEGYYVLIEVAAEPASWRELDRMLTLDDTCCATR